MYYFPSWIFHIPGPQVFIHSATTSWTAFIVPWRPLYIPSLPVLIGLTTFPWSGSAYVPLHTRSMGYLMLRPCMDLLSASLGSSWTPTTFLLLSPSTRFSLPSKGWFYLHQAYHASCVSAALASTDFVSFHEDVSSQPLSQLYHGLYNVLAQADKFFTLEIGSRTDTVSIDCLKPVHSKDPVVQ